MTTATPSAAREDFRLSRRWTPLRHHVEQQRLLSSPARFKVVPAGRRSGKTECAKRRVIVRACRLSCRGRKYVFAAPTRDQARRIYWADLKAMVPTPWVERIIETQLEIHLVNGTRLCVVGMDRPERIEGEPLDGIVLDEYANMKATAWTENVSPALDTPGRRPGWAWFIGVPEGRNHYFELWSDVPRLREAGESWDGFTWKSADILPEHVVESLRRRMDDRTFRQEMEGSFESFAGLAYYNWSDDNIHRGLADLYDPADDLIFCFDFNTSPGVAVVIQEMVRKRGQGFALPLGEKFTAVIGEVWIERNSKTPLVCDELIADWRHHRGRVLCYGDATGGAETTTSVLGSDWVLIERALRKVYGDRLGMRNRKSNPAERERVNAVNSRIASSDGTRRLYVDPVEAPHLVRDFERVETVADGCGAILKEKGGPLTHCSDSAGYFIHDRYPIAGGRLYEDKVA